jgi:hypothetical protein
MSKDDPGWAEWCRLISADFQRAANRTRGSRAANLSDLAGHYEAQADAQASEAAFAGNKPLLLRALAGTRRAPKSKQND